MRPGWSSLAAAPALTAGQAMPFVKADFTIDTVPTSAEIDRTLVKLETLAKERGLGYLDDGSTPRSAAPALAAGQAMPFTKAAFTIDAVPTAAEIDRALAKLESLAKERGSAVGVASALPISIERLAAWIKTLEGRGIMLVPLTTAMLKSKSG